MKLKQMKIRLILKPIRNARKVVGGALTVLVIAALVLGSSLTHQNLVDWMTTSVFAEELEKDAKLSPTSMQLYGIWTARDVDVKMGDIKIQITFSGEKNVGVMAWSDIPFVGLVRDLKGPFLVHGDTISSEAIRDGKNVKFSFESEQLVFRFKSGKVVRFDRE